MTDKVRRIQNPLTIVAIFAALAEVAGTVALATVDPALQSTFIWFVMGFPVLLVVLFFLTLNLNPRVLYAPSDFKDEANFIRIIMGSRRLTASFDLLAKQLDGAKEQIVNQVSKEVGAKDTELRHLSDAVNSQVELLRSQLEAARQSAQELASEATAEALPRSGLQAKILSFLSMNERMVSMEELVKEFGMTPAATRRALDRLEKRHLVHMGDEEGNEWCYVD